MFLFEIELWLVIQFADLAVDSCTYETLRHQVLHQLHMLALALNHDRRQHHQPAALGQPKHLVDHLGDGLCFEIVPVVRATGCAGAGVEESHVVIDFRDSAHGRAWIMRGRFLLDRYGW